MPDIKPDIHKRLIAILRGIRPQECEAIITNLLDAGFTAIELPLNSPDPFQSIAIASHLVKSRLGTTGLVGAGTVLSADEVTQVKQAGGNLIVSPNCDGAVISHAVTLGMSCYPGVFTPTEALSAIAYGATGLKFFPANILGPHGIKAIKAVLPPDIPVYAVGGVSCAEFEDYAKAGCYGFGLGSSLYHKGASAADITSKARKIIKQAQAVYEAIDN